MSPMTPKNYDTKVFSPFVQSLLRAKGQKEFWFLISILNPNGFLFQRGMFPRIYDIYCSAWDGLSCIFVGDQYSN